MRANHSIVVGQGAEARTIAAGQPLPVDMSTDDIRKLRQLEAITELAEPQAETEVKETPLVPMGTAVSAKAGAGRKTAS